MLNIQNKVRERITGVERLLAFSDGVFAIAITLLVLDIKLPELPPIKTNTDLLNALGELWPKFIAYIFSFLIVGQYWMLHHRMFTYIKRSDRHLLLINLYFLLLISFVPFPTVLLSEHGDLQSAMIFYAVSLIVCRLVGLWMWIHATRNHRLVDKELDQNLINYITVRGLATPVVFLISIVVSFISVTAAYWSWILIWPLSSVIQRLYAHEDAEDDALEFGETSSAGS